MVSKYKRVKQLENENVKRKGVRVNKRKRNCGIL
jgi:hypothetical protein